VFNHLQVYNMLVGYVCLLFNFFSLLIHKILMFQIILLNNYMVVMKKIFSHVILSMKNFSHIVISMVTRI
jgi:hypothetical protein